MKYRVVILYGASSSEIVEADSPDEAREAAVAYPTLCHHCSGELELGDPYDTAVFEEDTGDELIGFDSDDVKAEALRLLAGDLTESDVGRLKQIIRRM